MCFFFKGPCSKSHFSEEWKTLEHQWPVNEILIFLVILAPQHSIGFTFLVLGGKT